MDIVGETGEVEGESPGLDQRELDLRRFWECATPAVFESIAIGWEGVWLVGVDMVVVVVKKIECEYGFDGESIE